MFLTAATLFLLCHALASPAPLSQLEERQSNCPNIHVFGARETTAPPGYGTAGVVVNLILNACSGSTAEAISYPACGGQASCGGASYGDSALAGTAAVAKAVNAFHSRCPDTQLVLVGYSQGGQITDNAFCGGGDTNIGLSDTAIPIQASALNQIKAVILMGNPRYTSGLSYNVGTCRAKGFAPRPAGFSCPSASKVQSYCDAADPYCCTGSDQATHQGYGTQYGQQALRFVQARLSGSGTTNPQPTSTRGGSLPPASSPPSSGGSIPRWGQCGGQGYSGPTACQSPYACKAQNQWYSQCQ